METSKMQLEIEFVHDPEEGISMAQLYGIDRDGSRFTIDEGKGIAKVCAPDKFDFETGYALAVGRALRAAGSAIRNEGSRRVRRADRKRKAVQERIEQRKERSANFEAEFAALIWAKLQADLESDNVVESEIAVKKINNLEPLEYQGFVSGM